MFIKRIISAVSAAAVCSAAFAFPAASHAAEEKTVYAIAALCGQAGIYSCWDPDDDYDTIYLTPTTAEITGNGHYKVAWDLEGDGTGSIEFLKLQLVSPDTDTPFTSDYYPDLSLTVDEIWIDGVDVDFTMNDKAYTLDYYERPDNSGAVAYLVANWGVNYGEDLGISKDTEVISRIEVRFTVKGIPEPAVNYGDVNDDGSVDLNDAVAVLQYAALPEKYPLSEKALKAADVFDNGTSGINGSDALAIMMVDAGLITPDKLPVSASDLINI